MSSNKLISVIVPVYNSELTLEKCINSILNQSYRDLEIIMVDDASTDSSRKIMVQLEKTDPERIMAICSDENRGAGGARNIALQYANGDYLGFVDSDDYIHTDFYEKLVEELEKGNHDFVDCGYFDEAKDGAILHTGKNARGKLTNEMKSELIVGGGYLWSKLFRKELFYDNNITFRENCILEDAEVLIQLIALADSVGAVEETMYWYSNTKRSASRRNNEQAFIGNLSDAMKAEIGLREELGNYSELKTAIEYGILRMYDYAILKTIKDAKNAHKLDTLKVLNDLRNLRADGVTSGYDNPYVRQRIEETDIELMKLNDHSPELLIKKCGLN